MRNIIGVLAQQKLIRCLLSTMTIKDVGYFWVDGNAEKGWCKEQEDDYEVECTMKAIAWKNNTKCRTLGFNLKIPLVNNNVDLCLFDCDHNEYDNGKIVNSPEKIIMLGELKGGIDPAGADEHWKTGNSALDRIRMAFHSIQQPILTSFIGAAIENKMASEIYNQLSEGTLTNAANLTKDNQLIEYCDWLLTL
jgi:type II restriction enzyme